MSPVLVDIQAEIEAARKHADSCWLDHASREWRATFHLKLGELIAARAAK